MNNKRGKRGRKNGSNRSRGNPNRSSKLLRSAPKARTMTAVYPDRVGIYCECYGDVETSESHIIPRVSLSKQQRLGIKAPQFETEPLLWRQLDKSQPFDLTGPTSLDHHPHVKGSNNKLIWKSDDTLLSRGKPQAHIGAPLGGGAYGFLREGKIKDGLNKRKTLRVEIEEEPREKPIVPCDPILTD